MIRPSLQNFALFWSNPVVVRDMRVRMRGSRAFWNQAVYLAILSMIAVTGYGASTHDMTTGGFDPVMAQENLQQFYYWIFICLALLITLIAPALTAVAVVSEKKMQTMDLLVTTPMTAMQMLTGKLISSVAFILLLMALSIPASALCIILGGATLSDVLQTYLILVIDGVVLSAVGLTFSCSAKQHMQAITATYASILLFFVITYIAAISTVSSMFSHSSLPAVAAISELNPFFAAIDPGATISILGLSVPAWLAAGISAFIFVRLLLTRAALQLGMYGPGLVSSLRRQILFATFISTLLVGQEVAQISGLSKDIDGEHAVMVIVSAIFGVSALFLPALFVPVGAEDGPPGQSFPGAFKLLRTFSTDHSGALPFFQIWLLIAILGSIFGMQLPYGGAITLSMYSPPTPPTALAWPPLISSAACMYLYFSGMGFLYWSIARRCSWFTASPTLALPLTFALLALVLLLPLAIMTVQTQLFVPPSPTDDGPGYNAFVSSWVRFTWLLYPFDTSIVNAKIFDWKIFVEYAFICYALGLLIYPPWRSATPGARTLMSSATAKQKALS